MARLTDPSSQSETPRGSYLPQLRRHRDKKPPLQLQERDFEIIKAVWDNRFLTLSFFVQLFPPDLTRTPAHVFTEQPKRVGTNLERRLAKLFHHGYLRRVRTERGGELIYALDQKGAQLLRERQLPLSSTIDWSEKSRDLSNLYIDHALMVARFRTALTVAVREHPSISLRSFQRENADLKAVWEHERRRVYVNPDAFFILRDESRPEGRQNAAYFLEADRSTMTLKRLLEKYVYYSLMYTDGIHRETFRIPSFRVLTVAKSRERASNILKLVSGGDSPIPPDHRAFFYFTSEEFFQKTPQNILATSWYRADNPFELQAIVPSPLSYR